MSGNIRRREVNNPFVIGDKVKLKSGGPVMTVNEVSISSLTGMIECQWFAGNKLQKGHFAPDALERAEEAEKK